MTLFDAPLISYRAEPPLTARIFNIQHYSLNDGRGIRTTIFFKGCPHTCPWCANPESISAKIEIVRRESKCLHCRTCKQDPDLCPSTAMERIGYDITLDKLVSEILKDEVFYRTSGGGVTLSGGEVLMQADFADQLLQRLHRLGINIAIETAGDRNYQTLFKVARWCDEVLFDLKIMQPEQAKQLLNINQHRVLENLANLITDDIKVIPRIPLIPGYTMQPENLAKILHYLSTLSIKELHILPFHQYGEGKYTMLNQPYLLRDIIPPDEQQIEAIRRDMQNNGFNVIVGG